MNKAKAKIRHMCSNLLVLPGAGLFSDTVCTKDSWNSTWENVYKYFKDADPTIIVRTIIVDDETPTSKTTPHNARNSLHKIGERP